VKGAMDDASEDLREKESWAIFIKTLIIFSKVGKSTAK